MRRLAAPSIAVALLLSSCAATEKVCRTRSMLLWMNSFDIEVVTDSDFRATVYLTSCDSAAQIAQGTVVLDPEHQAEEIRLEQSDAQVRLGLALAGLRIYRNGAGALEARVATRSSDGQVESATVAVSGLAKERPHCGGTPWLPRRLPQ